MSLDELFLKHVAVPGIINSIYDPREKQIIDPPDSPTRSRSKVKDLPQISGGQRVITRRAKLLNKYKDREGPFVTLSEWIKKFDDKVSTGLEETVSRLQ